MGRWGLRIACIALTAGLSLAGCNVFEGLYEEGQADDPEILLEDALIALQRNEPERAVEHLQRALQYSTSDPVLQKRVQVKLASALLVSHDADVRTFSRIARNFQFDAEPEDEQVGKHQANACSFPASHAHSTFDPRYGVDFTRLESEAGRAALSESQRLVTQTFYGTESGFACDEASLNAAIAKLQEAGISNDEIAEALVGYAVAVALDSFLNILDAGGDTAEYYAVTPPEGSTYVGICFLDQNTCSQTVETTKAQLDRFGCVTRILEKRAALLESSSATELAEQARESFEELAASLDDATCVSH